MVKKCDKMHFENCGFLFFACFFLFVHWAPKLSRCLCDTDWYQTVRPYRYANRPHLSIKYWNMPCIYKLPSHNTNRWHSNPCFRYVCCSCTAWQCDFGQVTSVRPTFRDRENRQEEQIRARISYWYSKQPFWSIFAQYRYIEMLFFPFRTAYFLSILFI